MDISVFSPTKSILPAARVSFANVSTGLSLRYTWSVGRRSWFVTLPADSQGDSEQSVHFDSIV